MFKRIEGSLLYRHPVLGLYIASEVGIDVTKFLLGPIGLTVGDDFFIPLGFKIFMSYQAKEMGLQDRPQPGKLTRIAHQAVEEMGNPLSDAPNLGNAFYILPPKGLMMDVDAHTPYVVLGKTPMPEKLAERGQIVLCCGLPCASMEDYKHHIVHDLLPAAKDATKVWTHFETWLTRMEEAITLWNENKPSQEELELHKMKVRDLPLELF